MKKQWKHREKHWELLYVINFVLELTWNRKGWKRYTFSGRPILMSARVESTGWKTWDKSGTKSTSHPSHLFKSHEDPLPSQTRSRRAGWPVGGSVSVIFHIQARHLQSVPIPTCYQRTMKIRQHVINVLWRYFNMLSTYILWRYFNMFSTYYEDTSTCSQRTIKILQHVSNVLWRYFNMLSTCADAIVSRTRSSGR